MPACASVRPVITKKDLRGFLNLPFHLYRKDPLWTPQIRLFESIEFRRGTNVILSRSPHILFLARDGSGRTVGRIIAYEDPRYNSRFGTRTGFFGSFEAESAEAAGALFRSAEDWLRARGLENVLGPIDPIAECWGFTVRGFDRPPVFMSPHNPPRYPEWIEAAGFTKAKDLRVYEVDTRTGYRIPERYLEFEKHFMERHPEFTARRMKPKDLKKEVKLLVDITNAGVDGNWGFVPIGDDERDALADRLGPVVDPDIIWFIEDRGRPIACSLGFPDLNIPIRRSGGRLLPFGWFRLWRAREVLADYRLWGLSVLPDYHGLGLDALLYINLYRTLARRRGGIRIEANYVLEDNPRIVIGLEKLGLTWMKTYRVYDKEL